MTKIRIFRILDIEKLPKSTRSTKMKKNFVPASFASRRSSSRNAQITRFRTTKFFEWTWNFPAQWRSRKLMSATFEGRWHRHRGAPADRDGTHRSRDRSRTGRRKLSALGSTLVAARPSQVWADAKIAVFGLGAFRGVPPRVKPDKAMTEVGYFNFLVRGRYM